mmetsp:Transcript_44716/g.77829  ORF Transcript_44716/g.77829 Transcript_44716/m.77829 type:complete len:215 (-) Transcript_44716:92-736(-)
MKRRKRRQSRRKVPLIRLASSLPRPKVRAKPRARIRSKKKAQRRKMTTGLWAKLAKARKAKPARMEKASLRGGLLHKRIAMKAPTRMMSRHPNLEKETPKARKIKAKRIGEIEAGREAGREKESPPGKVVVVAGGPLGGIGTKARAKVSGRVGTTGVGTTGIHRVGEEDAMMMTMMRMTTRKRRKTPVRVGIPWKKWPNTTRRVTAGLWCLDRC